MKRSLGIVVVTALLAACQNSAEKDQSKRQDLMDTQAKAERDIDQKEMKVDQKTIDAQNEADKKAAQAQNDADRKKADAEKDLARTQEKDQNKIADKQREVTKADENYLAQSGQPVTVTGKVSDISKDAVHMKTDSGENLKLQFSSKDQPGVGTPSVNNFHEGDEVRASYRLMGNDKVIQHIEVVTDGK